MKASDVPTKLTPNKDQSAVKAEVEVCEVSLSVPCKIPCKVCNAVC